MIKTLLAILFSSSIGLVYSQLPGYAYYKIITVQAPQVIGPSNYNDFPILISHTDPDLRTLGNGGRVADVNGYDIQFTADDGVTLLDHQIEKYDGATCEIVMWVKHPNSSSSANTDLRIYYNNGAVTTDQSLNTTWDSGYRAVYHLNDNNLTDASQNNNDLSNFGTSDLPNGTIAGSRSFGSGNYLTAPNDHSLQLYGDITVSAWVDLSSIFTGYDNNSIVSYAGVYSPVEQEPLNFLYMFNVSENSELEFSWEVGVGNDEYHTSTTTINTSGLSLLSATKNTTTNEVIFYQNGVQVGSAVPYFNDATGGATSFLNIGRSERIDADKFIDADIDEVRISNVVRRPDWLLTSYNSMSAPSTFYNMGSENCVGPTITTCASDVTVNASGVCGYTLPDFTGSVIATDPCNLGVTFTQSPTAGTTLNAGVNTITLIATDGGGNFDQCTFDITVLANFSPTVVSCGQLLTGESTAGASNNISNFSCSGITTNGNDNFYQITVPTGNYWLQIEMDNLSDDTNTDANVYWIGNTCPLGTNCIDNEVFNASTGLFQNGTNILKYLATGPGTYFFVVDSDNGDLDSYDLQFNCIESGVEFDETCGAGVGDNNSDGIVPSINGSSANLDVEPCETYTFCKNIRIANPVDFEWPDSVEMVLGSCYTNVTNITPTASDPGVYNPFGSWIPTYISGSNTLVWDFNDPVNNFGDGAGSVFSCANGNGLSFDFCFDAEITSGCNNNSDLEVSILISDDGVGGNGGTASSADVVLISEVNINLPDPSFTYGVSSYCVNSANKLPTITGDVGGTFTSAPAGLAIDSVSGEIDFTSSITGSYTVTYSTNNACPATQNYPINISSISSFTLNSTHPTWCGATNGTITYVGLQPNTNYNVYYDLAGFTQGPLNIMSNSTGRLVIAGLSQGNFSNFVAQLNGCSETNTSTITLSDPSNPSIDAGFDQIVCENQPVTLTAINPDGAAIFWDNGVTDNTAFNPSVGTITYTATAFLLGCTASDTVVVTVNTQPSFTVGIVNHPTICGAGDGNIQISGLNDALSYNLSYHDGTSQLITNITSTGGNYILSSLEDGTYTSFNISIVSTGCAFASPTTLNLLDPVGPTINGGSDVSICLGDTVTLQAFNPDGAGISWSNSIVDGVPFIPSSIGNIEYIVSGNLAGCITEDTVQVNVVSSPSFTVGNEFHPLTCGGTEGTIRITGLNDLLTYNISYSDGSIQTLNNVNSIGGNFVLTGLSAGSYNQFTVSETSVGCSSSSFTSIDLIDPTPPIVNAGLNQEECSGTPITLAAFNPNNATLNWNNGVINNVSFNQGIGTTTYLVTASLNNCFSSDSVEVTINPLPTFNVGNETDPTVCNGSDGTITISGLNNGVFYNVNFLGNTFNTINSIQTSGGNYVINGLSDGTYNLFTVSDSLTGCSSTVSNSIVLAGPTNPLISAGPDFSVCDGDAITLQANNPDNAVVTWNNGVGDNVPFNQLVGSIDYIVTADLAGCISTDTISVTVNTVDNALFFYGASAYCTNQNSAFPSVVTPGGIFSSSNQNLVLDTLSGLIDLSNSMEGVYTVSYQTNGICPSDSVFEITI